MRAGLLVWAVAAVATAAGFAVPDAARAQGDHWEWRGAVAAGKTLEVRGINGTIRAQPADGQQAFVTADKRGRDDDPADVRIEVVEHERGVTICAVYPGRANTCQPGGGRMHVRDNDVQVDFEVRVPAGVTLVGDNVNGAVEAVGLTGRVDLETVNGGVTLETAGGEASAETVNGSIQATVRGAGTGPLSFETVNGGITIGLPAGLGASIDAQTVNGSVSTDFPITLSGRINPRELRGRIGQGGRELHVETVNGSIRLRSIP